VAFTREMIPCSRLDSVDMADTCRVDIHGVKPIAEACPHKGPEAGSCRGVGLHEKGWATGYHTENGRKPWVHWKVLQAYDER